MGSEQAARTMATVMREAMVRKGREVDEEYLDKLQGQIVDNFESQMDVFTTSAQVLDDAVIDPRETRAVLAFVLSVCRVAEQKKPQPMQFSVARP